MNNDLYGESAHKATSIHGRENIAALLENLDKDATIFVKNENKFDQMLPGKQILKSLKLLAKVELAEEIISDGSGLVNTNFSVAEQDGQEQEARYVTNARNDLLRDLQGKTGIPFVWGAWYFLDGSM